MAGSRTLKLSILADVDNLKKNLNAGANEVEGFGEKLGNFGKKAAAAFAVAGVAAAAYAGKLLVDGVKAAIEDEKAQATLAKTLENVTNATEAQIAATELYITKTSLAFGVTDDDLRPAFDRLVRSTSDLTKAQKLLNLAIDIAAGTGLSLTTVANALGKAQDGNVTALKKLGIETQKTIFLQKDNTSATQAVERAQLNYTNALEKYTQGSPQVEKALLAFNQAVERANNTTGTAKKVNLEFDEIIQNLSATFGGQAAVAADTFEGKLTRLKLAFSEGKETVGSFVISALTPLVTFIVQKAVPIISDLSNSIGENLKPIFKDLSDFFIEFLIPTFQNWWAFLSEVVIPGVIKTVAPIINGLISAFKSVATSIKNNKEELEPFFNLLKSVAEFVVKTLAPAIGTTLKGALDIIGKVISGLITGFGKVVQLIDGVVEAIKRLIELIKSNPLVQGIGNLVNTVFGGGKATGGAVNSSSSYMVGERGPEMFVPNSAGRIVPNNRLGGQTININVSGAIDPASTARQIADLLNSEASVSGSFNNLGQSRFTIRTA